MEDLGDLKNRLVAGAEEAQDELKELILAKRAKSANAKLDDALMALKKRGLMLEDSVDGAVLVYKKWSQARSDLLKLPSLSSWAMRKPFVGGEASAKEVQVAAAQTVQLTNLLLGWRKACGNECVTGLEGAKVTLRASNALFNAYIESAIKEQDATDKHAKAAEVEAKAKESCEAAQAEYDAALAAYESKKAAAPPPTAAASAATPAAAGEATAPEPEGPPPKPASLEGKKSKWDVATATLASKLTLKRTAVAELEAAMEKATNEGGAKVAEAEAAIGAAFTSLRTGYEKMAFEATGMLDSPDFAKMTESYAPVDEVQQANDAKNKKDASAMAAVALGETKEGSAAQELSVKAIITAARVAERSLKAASKAIGYWVKDGAFRVLGPTAVTADSAPKFMKWQCEKAVVESLLEQMADEETKAVVGGLLFGGMLSAGRADVETKFAEGAAKEILAAADATVSALSGVAKSGEAWLESKKKADATKAAVDAKTKAAEESAANPDESKRKEPPSELEVTEATSQMEASQKMYEALMATATGLQAESGAESLATLYVMPLKAFMTALTGLYCARGVAGLFVAPSDGVVHLEEVSAELHTSFLASEAVPSGGHEAADVSMGIALPDETAAAAPTAASTAPADAEAPAVEAASAPGLRRGWTAPKKWFKDVFEKDEEGKDERAAYLIVSNWTTLQEKGETLTDDSKVATEAKSAGMAIDVDDIPRVEESFIEARAPPSRQATGVDPTVEA